MGQRHGRPCGRLFLYSLFSNDGARGQPKSHASARRRRQPSERRRSAADEQRAQPRHHRSGLSEASPEMEEACAAYALHLGNAFQIADDILDYKGEAATIGKNLGADLREGKVTLPLLYAMQMTTPEDRERIREAVRNGDGDFEEISRIVMQSGALPKCLERAQQEVEMGKQKLSALPSGHFKESLLQFLALTVQRNK